MDSVRDCLNLFGLRPGATWDDINTAYRDLVRVWHPDRFHSDERLLKKANEQTAMLNLAMQKLRAEYSPENTTSKPNPNQTSKAQAKPRPAPKQEYQHGFAAQDRAERVKNFQLPPLLIRQRAASSISRILMSVSALTFSLFIMSGARGDSSRLVVGSGLALFAVAAAIKNLCILVFRRPIIRVDARGITTYDSGELAWGDLTRIWARAWTGAPSLAIECSPLYLSSQSWATRMVLKARRLIRRAHFVVRGSGLDAHPNDAVRAINAQHLTGHIDTTLRTNKPESNAALWCRFIAVLSALALMLRCSLNHELSDVDFAFYFAVFSACHAFDISNRLMRISGHV